MSNIGNYAKDPAEVLKTNLLRGYAGVRFEQGVPLLERDLNLQSQLLASLRRSIVEHYLGDGSPAGDDLAFQITAYDPPTNNFKIAAGTALVGGMEVTGSLTDYDNQRNDDPKLTPVETGQPKRLDVVYLDVWLEEAALADVPQNVDIDNDGDPSDVQRRTSMRLKPKFQVRVAEGKPMPAPAPGSGHAHYELAEIARKSEVVESDEITDRRIKNLNLAHLVQTLDSLQADLALIKGVLKPSLASKGPKIDRTAGYGGRIVTFYGKNFHIGDVKVEFIVNGVVSTQWIVGDVRPTSLQVRIDPAVVPGTGTFKITNGQGSVDYANFRVYGRVKWAAQPWTPGNKPGNSNITLYGDFFDCPGLELEISRKNPPDNWTKLVPSNATATTVTVKLPDPPSLTNYKIRARNEASRALYSGDEQWTYTDPALNLYIT